MTAAEIFWWHSTAADYLSGGQRPAPPRSATTAMQVAAIETFVAGRRG